MITAEMVRQLARSLTELVDDMVATKAGCVGDVFTAYIVDHKDGSFHTLHPMIERPGYNCPDGAQFTPEKSLIVDDSAPMTPEQFSRRMRTLAAPPNDIESEHYVADRLLCNVLRQLGYDQGVSAFESMEKHYV